MMTHLFRLLGLLCLLMLPLHLGASESGNDHRPAIPPIYLYCFTESNTGMELRVGYDILPSTLVGSFGDYGQAYGIFFNETLVWSFDRAYPVGGDPVTVVGEPMGQDPLQFRTFWVDSGGVRTGPYTLDQVACP